MGALELFKQIAAFLMRFVPIPRIATPTYFCVVWRLGRFQLLCTHLNGWFHTGFHVTWPLWSIIQRYEVHEVPLDIPEQQLTTLDGKSVGIDGYAIVKIVDPLKTSIEWVGFWGENSTVIIADSVRRAISNSTWEELSSDSLCETVRIDSEGELIEKGIKLVSVHLTSMQKLFPVAKWGN